MRCTGAIGPHAVRNNEQRPHVKLPSPHLAGYLALRPTSRPRVQGQLWGNTRGDEGRLLDMARGRNSWRVMHPRGNIGWRRRGLVKRARLQSITLERSA